VIVIVAVIVIVVAVGVDLHLTANPAKIDLALISIIAFVRHQDALVRTYAAFAA
jgi:hypothetical protein